MLQQEGKTTIVWISLQSTLNIVIKNFLTDEFQITNQSGRSLNAHFTIKPPFFIIDNCNCCTDNLDITLNNEDLFTLKVCFPFDIENSELVPQKYDGYIRIEYDEHKQIVTL